MFGIFSIVAIIANAILSLILYKIGSLFVRHKALFAYMGLEKFKFNSRQEHIEKTDISIAYLLTSTGRLMQFTAIMYVIISFAMSIGMNSFLRFM